jgi:predicted transcriptional regulator
MEVGIWPELQAKLAAIAERTGRGTEELLNEAVTRYVAEEQAFLEAVEVGCEQADRGQFVTAPKEVLARIQRLLPK